MKTRAFKKALSVLCVLSMLLSICVIGFAGTASAATTYTFNASGNVYTQSLEKDAALPAPQVPANYPKFLGWYDKTFTTKFDKAGTTTELYAKFDAVVLDFDDGQDYYDPNSKFGIAGGMSNYSVVDDPLDPASGNKVLLGQSNGQGLSFGLAGYSGVPGGFKLDGAKKYVVTFKVYITGVTTAQPALFQLYSASDAGIGNSGNKNTISSQAVYTENTSGWITVTLTTNANLTADRVKTQPNLVLFAVGGQSIGGRLYYDDIMISEATDRKVTLINKGTQTTENLKTGDALPVKTNGSFLGWYNKDLVKYTNVPPMDVTLYAVYNGTYANFEKTGYWDPNGQIAANSAMTIDVVNDPLGRQGKVALFDMRGNENVLNVAPSVAEGLSNAGTKLAAGQYRLRFKYYATGVNSEGVYIELRTANAAGVGQGGDKSGTIASTAITASTSGWTEMEIIFTVNAAQAAFDSFILLAQDGMMYGNPKPGTVDQATAMLYVDDIDIKPYMDASGIVDTVMNFENNFQWSVAEANSYTTSTGNGYVTRGEILSSVSGNHYFQMKNYRNKNGYFWFTVNDGTKQFQLNKSGLYTVEFDYYVVHSETETSIGVLSVDPTKTNSITELAECVTFEYRDDTEWAHAKMTFQANTDSGRTSLGIYLKNKTNVPEEYATVVNFDNIVVTSHSVSGEDGIIVFDDMGADYTVDPIVVEDGRTPEKLPTPAKYGYDFMGWKYDVRTGGTDEEPEYTQYTLTTSTVIPAGTLNVYAEWKLNAGAVELQFYSNVPEFDEQAYTVVAKHGQPISNMPPNPSATGQKFLGWYLDTTFQTPLDANKAPAISGRARVYAKWDVAGVIIDYEEFNNRTHGAGRVSDRYEAKMFQGDMALCYDLSVGSNSDPAGHARAMFYDGTEYFRAFEGLDYTVTFKYYIEKVAKVGSFNIYLSSASNTWANYAAQKGGFTYTNTTGEWLEGEISFTATQAANSTGADNYMSISVSGDAVLYIDDVVITCAENTMNHYGSAVVFNTQGGNKLPTMSGQPGEKFELPKPKRAGYLFKGWFLDAAGTEAFTDPVYGEETIQLYAIWQLGSFTESFEDYPASVKALGVAGAYKFYSKTESNFDAANVYHGAVSLFRDGTSSGDKVFTLARSSDLALTVGSSYTLTMWVKPVSITDTNSAISMVSLPTFTGITKAQPITKLAGVSELKEGEWQQITYHFTATSEFIGISTSAGCDMYIDEINITLDGYTGSDTGDSSISPIVVLIIAILAAGALLITAKKVFVK